MTLKEEMLKELKQTIQRQKHQIQAMWLIIGFLALAVAAMLIG